MDNEPKLYSIEEVLERVPISRMHLYRLRKRGDGPEITPMGRRVFVSEAALIKWVRKWNTQKSREGQ